MRTFIPIASLLLLTGYLSAQLLNSPFQVNYPIAKTTSSLSSDYFCNSNAISASFVNAFYQGQFINTGLINKVSGNLAAENRMGAEFNAAAFYSYQPDSLSKFSKFGFFFSIQDRNHADINFPKDLFNLLFYGNKSFEGQTAYLNNFNLHILQYQQFQVGITCKIGHSGISYGIGLSALNGQQYQNITASKAELFTSTGGQYIDLNSNISYQQSDISRSNLGSNSGAGFGMDAYLVLPIFIRQNRSEKFTVELRDFGMIAWNKSSRTATADSAYHYDGVAVNNILDLNNSAFGKANSDSILKKAIKFNSGKITSPLPTVIHINSLSTFGKWQLSKGLRYMFNANYRLNAYLTANYYLTKKLMLSLGASYGGYSLFNVNTGIAVDFGKGCILRLYSNNIEGFILPQIALGQSASISLMKKF